MKPFPLVTALLALLPSVFAQENKPPAPNPAEEYEARTFTGADGAVLNYRLLRPQPYDAAKQYPLVIVLHGAGERGSDNLAQLKYGAPLFCKPEVRQKYPCFVLAPQCPAEQKWVDIDWSSDTPQQPEKLSPSAALTLGALETLQKEFAVDADRIYLTGLSMGGYGTWDWITRMPEKWAAAAPICGGGDKTKVARAKDVPIWVFHGMEDGAVKFARSAEMVAALQAAGGAPAFSEYPYVGHDSWNVAYGEPQFLPWLFAQKRGQKPVSFATVAGPIEQPPSNLCPGAGPMQSGLWFRGLWKGRRSEWLAAKAADQGAVVFFGDSITQGWGSLAQDFPTLKIANRGISGDTTRGLLTRLQGDVIDLHPAAISMLIGTNDLDQGGTPEVIAANLKAIVAELHRALPQTPIVINKVMPRGPNPKRNFAELIPKLNGLYEAAFAQDALVTFVDTWSLFNDGAASVSKDEFPDLLHPNAAGYAKWTAALQPVFAQLKIPAPPR